VDVAGALDLTRRLHLADHRRYRDAGSQWVRPEARLLRRSAHDHPDRL